jgi:DNA-binding transcriptional MerR regulator
MHSSELARLSGVSPDTLRYYERNRLLPMAQRSASGYRLFPPEAAVRVKMIRGALSVGFSVKELGRIFSIRDKGGSACHEVRALGTDKLRKIEFTIRDLQSKHRQLKQMLVKWDRLLKNTRNGKRAGLLELFAHPKRKSK